MPSTVRLALILVLVACAGAPAPATGPDEQAPVTARVETDVPLLSEPPPCSGRSSGDRTLCQPRVIESSDRNIDTCMRIEMMHWCRADSALVYIGRPPGTGSCPATKVLALRSYGVPRNPRDPETDCQDAVRVRDLEWSLPAPTLKIQHPGPRGSGQGFRIKLVNDLADIPDGCRDPERDKPPNCFHGDNVTNLHFHGFRVSPKKPQDWVFLKLEPGKDFQYAVEPITEIQPPGTHWYHPHKHGSTALQVGNGMAGAFIVAGYLDRSALGAFPQRVLVVQQIFADLDHFPEAGGVDQTLWVNGIDNPVITAVAGRIQWWRMVAAMQKNSSQLVLDLGFAARQIAQDGIPFTQKQYADQRLDLSAKDALFSTAVYGYTHPLAAVDAAGETPLFHFAAGNRMDVLVRAPEVERWPARCREPGGQPKPYCEFSSVATQIAVLPDEAMKLMPSRTNDLVTLRVLRAAGRQEFPPIPERPEYLQLHDVTLEEVGPRTKRVVFSADKGPGNSPDPPRFCIDGNQYSHDRIDQCLEVGTAARWHLENRAPEAAGLIAHPFHIHTNPFQIWSVDDEPWSERIWFDTFALPTNRVEGAGRVTIRHRFVRFDGDYVLHCHILGHEDRGMMQNVKAFRPGERCVEGKKTFCDTCPCPPATSSASTTATGEAASLLDELTSAVAPLGR